MLGTVGQVRIGSWVTARDLQGVVRRGRVVATETVTRGDLRGRTAGRWFMVALQGRLFENIELPEERIQLDTAANG